MPKLLVVNLIGAPGSGKSTSAAHAFSVLKNKGCNVELIQEYAKQLVYQKRQHEMSNQLYILAKQFKKLDDIAKYNKVPMVLNDGPLIHGLIYAEQSPYFKELETITKGAIDQFDNFNVFVKRNKPYNPSGRNQTEEESDALSLVIEDLSRKDIHMRIMGGEEGQAEFAAKCFELYRERIKQNADSEDSEFYKEAGALFDRCFVEGLPE